MNSRLNQFRGNPPINRKRKYEDEQLEPKMKKRFSLPSPPRNQPDFQPYRPENVQEPRCSTRPNEQAMEEPRRYSANDRLKKVRHNIEQTKRSSAPFRESPPPLHNKANLSAAPFRESLPLHNKPNLKYSPSNSSPRTGSSPDHFFSRTTPMLTAKPSSLQERINKLRNSANFRHLSPENYQPEKKPIPETTKVLNKLNFSNQPPKIGRHLNLPMHCANTMNRKFGPISKSTEDASILTNPNRERETSTYNHYSQSSVGNKWSPPNKSTKEASVPNKPHRELSPYNRYSESSLCRSAPANNVVATTSKPPPNPTLNATCSDDLGSDDCMDWESFTEKEIVSNLHELRKTTRIGSSVPQTPFQEAVAREAKEIQQNKALLQTIYIVVDTNIFLSQLETVKNAMKLKINGTKIGVCSPIIFVPWIVIQELDYIKDGKHNIKLKKKAQEAVRFINECLRNKTNLKGQSVRDAAQQDFASSNFDDGILHCCLQIRDRRNRAILLSNDVNLTNKLLNEGFEAYDHKDFFKKMDPFRHIPKPIVTENTVEENPAIVDISNRLRHLCALIIRKELKEAYGEIWIKLGGVNKPHPWSLDYCLQLFQKYWIPVFGMSMHKQSIKHIDEFRNFVKSSKGPDTDLPKFLDLALQLCMYLKTGYPLHFSDIRDCINSMEKHYESIGG